MAPFAHPRYCHCRWSKYQRGVGRAQIQLPHRNKIIQSFDLILLAGKGSILFYEFPFFEVFVCRLNHIKM